MAWRSDDKINNAVDAYLATKLFYHLDGLVQERRNSIPNALEVTSFLH